MSVTASRRNAPAGPRRPTNVTLPETLLVEAKAMAVNVSQACESGLAKAVADERRRRWLEDNREAMESWNAYVEEHGLPLARHRLF